MSAGVVCVTGNEGAGECEHPHDSGRGLGSCTWGGHTCVLHVQVCGRMCDCMQGHAGVSGKWEPKKESSLRSKGVLSTRLGSLQDPKVGQFMEALRARQWTLGFNPRTTGGHGDV